MTTWHLSDLIEHTYVSDNPDAPAFVLPGNEYSLLDYLNALEAAAEALEILCTPLEINDASVESVAASEKAGREFFDEAWADARDALARLRDLLST